MRKIINLVVLMNIAPAFASGVVQNVTARQIQPWGLVEIKYEQTEDMMVPPGALPFMTVVCEDRQQGVHYTARTFVKQPSYVRGDNTLLWDARADDVVINSSNVVFRLTIETKPAPYCVIDVSGGTLAATYPVSLMRDVPTGGWTDEYKTKKIVLRRIEPGTFMMNGSYRVTLTKPYYIGVFEVTQKQYELVMGAKTYSAAEDKCAVGRVSWNTIVNSFMPKLRQKTGLAYDLPTEAQWEYACRAGTGTVFSYGNVANGDYMWYYDNSYGGLHDVGMRLPNVWGLYDMHGNAEEWCRDRYGELSAATDPEGSGSYSDRVIRGGGSGWVASYCTSSYRGHERPEYSGVGFRLCRTLQDK